MRMGTDDSGNEPGEDGLRQCRPSMIRRMTRSMSRILTPEDLDDWRAEHCWRTLVFMTADHMYYSINAWVYGFFMCVITIVSCFAFVLSTMPVRS